MLYSISDFFNEYAHVRIVNYDLYTDDSQLAYIVGFYDICGEPGVEIKLVEGGGDA